MAVNLVAFAASPLPTTTRLTFQKDPALHLVAEARVYAEVQLFLQPAQPTVILVDWDELHPAAIGELRRGIQKTNPLPYLLFWGSTTEGLCLRGLLTSGVTGFLLKTEEPTVLSQAVKAVARGEPWLSPAITRAVMTWMHHQGGRPGSLSEREWEVLQALTEGNPTRQIALALNITERTVKFHIDNIYTKLGTRSRIEAVKWALQHGLGEG